MHIYFHNCWRSVKATLTWKYSAYSWTFEWRLLIFTFQTLVVNGKLFSRSCTSEKYIVKSRGPKLLGANRYRAYIDVFYHCSPDSIHVRLWLDEPCLETFMYIDESSQRDQRSWNLYLKRNGEPCALKEYNYRSMLKQSRKILPFTFGKGIV